MVKYAEMMHLAYSRDKKDFTSEDAKELMRIGEDSSKDVVQTFGFYQKSVFATSKFHSMTHAALDTLYGGSLPNFSSEPHEGCMTVIKSMHETTSRRKGIASSEMVGALAANEASRQMLAKEESLQRLLEGAERSDSSGKTRPALVMVAIKADTNVLISERIQFDISALRSGKRQRENNETAAVEEAIRIRAGELRLNDDGDLVETFLQVFKVREIGRQQTSLDVSRYRFHIAKSAYVTG